MSVGTTRRSIRVDDELWQQFITVCAEEDTDASTVLRGYIRGHIRMRKEQREYVAWIDKSNALSRSLG